MRLLQSGALLVCNRKIVNAIYSKILQRAFKTRWDTHVILHCFHRKHLDIFSGFSSPEKLTVEFLWNNDDNIF